MMKTRMMDEDEQNGIQKGICNAVQQYFRGRNIKEIACSPPPPPTTNKKKIDRTL